MTLRVTLHLAGATGERFQKPPRYDHGNPITAPSAGRSACRGSVTPAEERVALEREWHAFRAEQRRAVGNLKVEVGSRRIRLGLINPGERGGKK